MEKRKLVLTIIGVVILAIVIMVYIYFSKPGKDEKKNQQTINQVQTVQQKTNEKKIHPEMNWKMLRREATNTMDQNLLKRHTSRYMSFTKNRDYRNQRLINW